jgi:glycosyltransferase involved in cell wall biosynthesis
MVRVLIVHNSYQQAGGEDAVVANEYALLDRHGWETRLWTVSNDSIIGAWTKIATAIRTPYSRVASDRLAAVIADFSPAVVHIHNFFPLLTPSVYDACRTAGVAVVQTLHNYRTICAGSLLQRNGHACEDCIGASPYQAVLHGCYRGSRIGSVPVARMIDLHRRRGTWLHKVDRFIALSAFAKSKFVAAGFPADKIVIKPHFAQDRPVSGSSARAGALYVGRLSAEKGITTLLRAWRDIEVPLRVVGDGPLRGLVERAASSKIVAVGWKTPAEVAEEMARAAWLIVPSIAPENFGLVIIEAFSHALPVIASRIPTLEGIVNDGENGLLFSAGDAGDLASKVSWAFRHPEAMWSMGVKARRAYEENFSPSVNLRQLTKIYEAAIDDARSAAVEQPAGGEFAIRT